MNVQHAHCSREQLRQLLVEDPHSEDAGAAANHVEQCNTCQAQLTQLAGDDSWWSEARDSLAGETDQRWEPNASWTAVFSEDAEVDEGFPDHEQAVQASIERLLAAPRHPEMLGRLGRYEIESIIGYGGMGAVLKAHDSQLNRPVAIKVLAAHLAHVGAARQRFAREGRAAAAVVHDHVVAVHNVESHGDAPFLVMQYVPGQSLQGRVEKDGPLTVAEILRIGMQAAAGLAAAHAQGLVHRDVKPSNILLENGVERAMLTDFGLARAIDDASLTRTGVIAGTPHYMSPEQARGEPVDRRSDLFSLGAVLYFMATGHPPFRAANTLAVLNRICHEPHRPVWQVEQHIPDDLSDLIDQLLEKKPSHRPATAQDVQQKLAAMLSRHQQYGASRRRFFRHNRRTRRRLAWAGAGLALLAIGGVAGAAWWTSSGNSASQGASEATSSSVAETMTPAWRDEMTAAQREYIAGVNEAHAILDGADATMVFDAVGDASWRNEIESIQAALDALESTYDSNPNFIGAEP